jgi:hypothetical protein
LLFETSAIESPLEYHGLSYAWKDITLDKDDLSGEEIVVNGSRMVIGRNLAAALKARQSHEFRSIPLWVDAMCINQEDVKEKNDQILRMRDIYAQASLVTVWLGPERDDSSRALDHIRRICQASTDFEGWARDPSGEVWVKDSSKFSAYLRDRLVTREHSKDWQALHSLLRRAWWKRMWIVQETVAAKRLMFFCGSRTLDPQDISHFLDILAAHAVTYLPLLSQTEGIVLEDDIFSLARAYLRPTTWSQISVLRALYRTGMALSTDPRDKIYAILALAYDGAKIVPNPDYTLSIEEIFKQLVISLVKEIGRLDVLSVANLPVYPRKLDISLPSWVPDWTYRVTNTVNSRVAAVRAVWADKDSRAIATFSDDNNTMTAKGFIVDIVDGLAQCANGVEQPVSHSQLHQSKSRRSKYTGIGAIDAIWRSLLANRPASATARLEHVTPETRIPEPLSLFLQQCSDLSSKPVSTTHSPPPKSVTHIQRLVPK